MQVYLLRIKVESQVYLFVCSSHQKAIAKLARWCRNCRQEQGHEGDDGNPETLPDDDDLAVARYFGFWHLEESYRIEEKEIDGDD